MSLRGRLASLFPAAHLALVLAGFGLWIASRHAWWLAWIIGFTYLFPPLVARLHQIACPLKEGWQRLDTPDYSPWWGMLQIQALFNAMPFLEAILRLIPGAYSAWLRLWGSQVGRAVVWTPRVEISDRSLLAIGDGAIFGHRVALYPHVVDKRRSGILLYAKRITVGNRAFIGAGSRLGPGAAIADDARLPILTDVYIGQRIEAEP